MTRRRTSAAGVEAAPIRAYGLQQTRTLLRRLAYQVNQTARTGSEDAVHDLRVSIRRFTQCLRAFEQFIPKNEARKVRHRLKAVMKLAATVRDHDVALDVFKEAGVPKGAKVLVVLKKQRAQAEKGLLDAIRRSSHDNFSRKWREKLEL